MALAMHLPIAVAAGFLKVTDKRMWRVVFHYVGAAVARMESKMAAAASQAALQLERARKELADERALTQEIVTEAKQEAAAAMAQTLEAREDALRWQRAMTPNTTISGL